MRFKKGSKVEVLSKEEVPSGAWRCAEILWGNGHNYDVKYDWSPGSTGSPLTGRVSRKHIRPCPPSVGDSVDWLPGDLVEVLDNISWKIATVLKVMNGDYFLVRLLESSQELRVQKSLLRVRQSWQHDRWVIVGNKEDSHPTKGELSAEIPRLELHAYRCTMEALYASGPLSWEQEELVTNLCLALNISNDEHLMEIKSLVSA
ncbi:hypothetical protein MKX01_002149 [Papaver californicum]|nr:hypothetical protein MKX01_002149 [Papaver californicum]